MGYDETLASKIHALLQAIGPCDRSGMFGAVAFSVHGNIAAGVEDSSVFMRVGEAHAADLLRLPGIKPWPLDGKPQKGWILITPNASAPTVVMRERLGWAYQTAAALPPKEVPRPAAAPAPQPAPSPTPAAKPAPVRRAPTRPAAAAAPPLPVTAVIAPGMSRPLAPPSRFPYKPEAARAAPAPLTTKAQAAKTRPPESSARGRLEVGLPATVPVKPGAAKKAARKPPAARPKAKAPARKAGGARPKPARPKAARPKAQKPTRKAPRTRAAARTGKKSGKKK